MLGTQHMNYLRLWLGNPTDMLGSIEAVPYPAILGKLSRLQVLARGVMICRYFSFVESYRLAVLQPLQVVARHDGI